MTISSTASEISYAGNGATVAFPIPFPFDTSADIKVTSTVTATGDVSVLSSGFSITGGGGSTGTITFTIAPASTVSITLIDDPARTQPTDYVANDAFPAESHERALDRVTRLCKRLYQRSLRSLRVPDGDPVTDAELAPVSTRKGKYLFFDAITGAIDYATAIATTTLSQGTIGALLYPRTAAEISAGVTPTDYAYPPGWTERYGSGAAVAAATNKTALTNAIASNDEISVGPGTYDYLTISASSKRITMRQGVTIKIPNATVAGGAVTGPSVLDITGANVTIDGDFTIDGNKANNDASSFPSSVLTGALHVSGDNCRINGTVTINNAYWRGLVIENGSSTGNEVDRFYCRRVKVFAPVDYAVMPWTVSNWRIDDIDIDRDTTLGGVARVRFGTQTSSSGQCKNGSVGSIRSNGAVVFESGSKDVQIDSVECSGFKFQDATDCQVGTIVADQGLLSSDEGGNTFAMLTAERCQVGLVIARGHRSAGTWATAFSPVVDCSVETLIVTGTTSNIQDLIIRSADGLHLGTVILRDPVGTGGGFIFDTDAAYTPQKNIVINSLVSTGHTGSDVTVESDVGPDVIEIRYINPNATLSIGVIGPTGSFQWNGGTATRTVTTPFATSISHVSITPCDANAAAIMGSAKAPYITKSAGSFVLHTGDASNTAANSQWTFRIEPGLTGNNF